MRMLAIALCSTALLFAQERRGHPGRVFDKAGKPAANATVTLVYAPAFAREMGGNDIVTTTTDEKGRFRAALLYGARYYAFAGSATGRPGCRPDVVGSA